MRGWVMVLGFAAACGGSLATTDGRNDGGMDGPITMGPCTSSSDCPSGSQCLYPANGGCSAAMQCIPVSLGQCKGEPACSCSGMNITICGGATEPVAHVGPCLTEIEGGCTTNVACENCDVSGFTPPELAKPTEMPNACSASQLAAFVVACVSSTSTSTTCNAWLMQDSGTCGTCLTFSQITAPTWGPFYCTSSSCTLNAGSCVDLELKTVGQEKKQGGPGSCGDAVTTAYACDDYVCGSCTTMSDSSQCYQDAAMNECAAQSSVLQNPTGPCAALTTDAGPSVCFPSTDADMVNFINVFCGTGP